MPESELEVQRDGEREVTRGPRGSGRRGRGRGKGRGRRGRFSSRGVVEANDAAVAVAAAAAAPSSPPPSPPPETDSPESPPPEPPPAPPPAPASQQRKRGRPPTKVPEQEPESLTELQHAERLFQEVVSLPKINPFWEKPNEFMFGMSNYYDVIKKPIWLSEIQRKMNSELYKSISEITSDVRLMLENCFKFWGPNHRLTNLALSIENKLNGAIDSLPTDIQVKCRESLIKEEPSEFSGRMLEDEDSNDSTKELANGNCKEKNSKESDDGDQEVTADDERLLLWENELVTDEIKSQMSSIWQLPALGQFLRVSYDALNISEIRQFELERMLLMPKESMTLSTLLTSILSPPAKRSRLDAAVPLMPYEIWNKKLHAKVTEWCDIYNKSNKMEVFMTCGVEPLFWSSMDFSNPYNGDFCELTYYQRVVILKALCDNLYHSEKNIQELFLDEMDNYNSSVDFQLGSLNNFMYFFVPCWPDVRVYKQRMIPKSKWEDIKDDLGITTKLMLKIAVTSAPSDEEDFDLDIILRDFELVAQSEKEVIGLAERGSSAMAVRIGALQREAYKHKPSLRAAHARSALFRQWNTQPTPEESEKRKLYWEKIERAEKEKNGLPIDFFIEGKRQRKERVIFGNDSDSEDNTDIFEGYNCSDEDASGSDWEPDEKKKKTASKKLSDEERKKPKKKKEGSIKKEVINNKKKTEPIIANIKVEMETENSSVPSIPSIVTVQSLKDDVSQPKVDNFKDSSKDFSPVHFGITIKEEMRVLKQEVVEESKTIPEPQKLPSKLPTVGQKINVKQEIIDLSSDDDEPVITPVSTPIKVVAHNSLTKVQRSPVVGNKVLSPKVTPVQSPRGTPITSPRGSPRGILMTPRNPGVRTPVASPRFSPSMQQRYRTPPARTPVRPAVPRASPVGTRPTAQRSLFGNTPTKASPTKPSPAKPHASIPPGTIPCKILVGRRENGSFGYIARLEDGGVFDISPDEVSDIRMRNNGGIPNIVYLPRGRLGF